MHRAFGHCHNLRGGLGPLSQPEGWLKLVPQAEGCFGRLLQAKGWWCLGLQEQEPFSVQAC